MTLFNCNFKIILKILNNHVQPIQYDTPIPISYRYRCDLLAMSCERVLK